MNPISNLHVCTGRMSEQVAAPFVAVPTIIYAKEGWRKFTRLTVPHDMDRMRFFVLSWGANYLHTVLHNYRHLQSALLVGGPRWHFANANVLTSQQHRLNFMAPNLPEQAHYIEVKLAFVVFYGKVCCMRLGVRGLRIHSAFYKIT